jgi:hypothetical protein
MEHYQLTLTKARLAKLGSFRAELISDEVETLEPEESVAAHRKVIRPLLAAADECYVYGLRRGSPLLAQCEAILSPDRGRYALDLSREVVVGYEPLWNATARDRGSIVAVVPTAAFDRAVFRSALRFYVISNPNISHTPAAIRFCRAAAKAGKLAFSFTKHSSRNVQVYGPPRALQQMYLSLPKGKRVN